MYDGLYRNCSSFRQPCDVIIAIWAVGLFVEFLARLILIPVHLSVTQIFLYAHVILGVAVVMCGVLTTIYQGKGTNCSIAFELVLCVLYKS